MLARLLAQLPSHFTHEDNRHTHLHPLSHVRRHHPETLSSRQIQMLTKAANALLSVIAVALLIILTFYMFKLFIAFLPVIILISVSLAALYVIVWIVAILVKAIEAKLRPR